MLNLVCMRAVISADTQTSGSVRRHFYQFYKGREDLFRIAIPFLRVGLANHEACLWVVSNAIGVLEAVTAFQRHYDLARFIEKGQLLVLPTERWYLDRGRFSERKVLEKLKKFIEEKKARGFKAFRGVGDTGWLDPKDWHKFQSYEEKANKWVEKMKFTVLCAYPIEQCSLVQTKDIVDHHDGVFLSKL